ncbi:MAG TPA: hypothetical protein VGK99_10210 [Acidobacteriota bacterium]|jgi:hypothetical protein
MREKRLLRITSLLAWGALCLGINTVYAADDLSSLSDEFKSVSTLALWQRIYSVEGWNADQLELLDINATRPGMMVMMPYTSTWFNYYRGELTFREVEGDFVVTTEVEVSRRGGSGPPRSQYSLGGVADGSLQPVGLGGRASESR